MWWIVGGIILGIVVGVIGGIYWMNSKLMKALTKG